MVLGNGVLLKGGVCILEVPTIEVPLHSGTSDSGLSQTRTQCNKPLSLYI